MTHPPVPAGSAPSEVDPHGHAALLLVESLIHALTDRSVLTVAAALEVVDVAISAQDELAADGRAPQASMIRANALLASVRASLRHDTFG